MSVPAVLIRKSTKQIIKHADYPKADLTPFAVGEIDPDYEWLIKNIPFAEPSYDSRVWVMTTVLPDLNFIADFIEHPQYAGIREYRITYEPVKRPNEDIIRSIENAEKEANNLVFSDAVHKDEIAFMLNSVHKDAKSLGLTAEEQTQIDKLSLVTVALAKNKDNTAILTAQVIAGLEPNIDLGWEKLL